MWCPEGFVPFNQKVSDFRKLAQRYANTIFPTAEVNFEALCVPFGDFAKDGSGEAVGSWAGGMERQLAQSAAELFHAWLIDSSLVCFEPHICSPDGSVLKLESEILCHDFEIGLVEWKSIQIPSELLNICIDNAFTERADAIWDGFRCFHFPSGIIREVARAETRGGAIDLRHTLSRKFEGWAICFKDNEIPDDGDRALEELDFDPSCLWTEDNETAGARKGRLERTLHDILQAYPAGKEDSWGEVERKTGYSRRTIMRTIQSEKADWWLGKLGK